MDGQYTITGLTTALNLLSVQEVVTHFLQLLYKMDNFLDIVLYMHKKTWDLKC